jgi:hypothetical protein
MRIEGGGNNSSFESRILGIVRSVATAAETLRRVYAQGTAQAAPKPSIETAIQTVLNIGKAAAREAAEYRLGHWEEVRGFHPQTEDLSTAVRSRDARYGKTTIGLGTEPQAWSATFTGAITPVSIADGQRRATMTGWQDWRVDTSSRFLRDDSHVGGVDQIRRSGFYRYPFRVAPRRGDFRPSSILLANAVRAAIESISGFTSACAETTGAMFGFGCGELVWKPGHRLTIPAGKKTITVESEIVSFIEPIVNRYFAFDVVSERPYLCFGPSEYVDISAGDLQKFLWVKGDGQAGLVSRFRGWSWSNDWLSYLAALDLEKFGILIETFGVSTPFLQRNTEGTVSPSEAQQAIGILEAIGTGKPTIIPARLGELKHSPVPTALAPLHAQFLSSVRQEQSKRILSSTLQTQLSSNGSWAAADVHEGQETKVGKIDTALTAEAIQDQLVKYLVDANAEAWASAFSRYVPGGITPDDLRTTPLLCGFVVTDETPLQRTQVFAAARALGLEVDPEQVREETGIRAPMPQIELSEGEP